MNTEKAIKTLQDREIAAAQAAGEEFFLGIPDAWYEPHAVYGCDNGHASRRYLKSETRGCLCLECHQTVAIMPHKYDTDEKLSAALVGIRAKQLASASEGE